MSSPVDFSDFKSPEKTRSSVISVREMNKEENNRLRSVGFDPEGQPGSGGFLLYGVDEFAVPSKEEGVEIMPLSKALRSYPEIKDKYHYHAVDRDQDEFTKMSFQKEQHGYFIRVKKNVKAKIPLHAGLFMHREKSTMCVHNIVIVEEGAHLHLITGCTSGQNIKGGLHIAVSEHYVGKHAEFINTMIHNWGPEFIVRPRTATIVEEGGAFVSRYYSVNPPRDIETKPYTHLKGRSSFTKNMNVLVCLPDTYCSTGGTVLMSGENSSAELIARAVNHGGTVVQTGLLIGAAKDARGHVDCSGLMLGDKGFIEAVPGLRSEHPDAKMSHEAAIGKIDMGEVNYLQSKGLDEMQAVTLIVRGFLDIGMKVEGMDKALEKIIRQISDLSGHGET